MTTRSRAAVRAAIAVTLIGGLSACEGAPGPLSAMFGGPEPTETVTTTLPRPAPDSRGVITYASYQVMVARQGDTVEAMAARVGLDPAALARHNGLPTTYSPREGEVLALPENVGGQPAVVPAGPDGGIWSSDIAASAIDSAPITPSPAPTTADPGPFRNGQTGRVIDPVRHRVQPGETAFSIARLHGVSVQSLANWNGLDSDLSVRADQELLIPVADPRQAGAAAPAAPPVEEVEVAAVNPPGTATPIAPPPSAATPLPENQDLAAVEAPPSPNLGEARTSASTFGLPVEGGNVLVGFDPDGPAKSEGIDFAAAAGAPVLAASDGEVALISESLGGLGTIVLIRHSDNLMSVYGRVTDVSLNKGDPVTRGQKIGAVAAGETPNVHFEIRRGTDAIDPGPFLDL